MAIREYICPVHGKFEVRMSIRELPKTQPCPAPVLNDPDSMAVENYPAFCWRESGWTPSVPGLIVI